MTSNLPSRRNLLRVGALTTLSAGVLGSVAELATAARAAVPTSSSRAALASAAGCATLTPEETQGPFWVDERLHRSDIRADSDTGAVQAGIPLTLTITLQDVGASCAPQVGAYVDIWHANAQGAYSDVSGSGNPNNIGVDWLRGYQVSDENGQVTFTTIYPGWYVGRTIHIHFRVRTALDGAEVNFTSQLFFAETVNNTVVATSAYQKSGTRTTNATDGIYDAALLTPVSGTPAAGYTAAFTVNLDFGDGTTDTGNDTPDTANPGTTADTTVTASVLATDVVRYAGQRIVRVRVRRSEKVTAVVRLVRDDTVLARTTTGWLTAGTSTVRLRVPRKVRRGNARVVVVLADAQANRKVVRRKVWVPRR